METTPIKRVQSLAYLALQGNIRLIKIGIGIGMEKNIMEQLAPHALLDIIVLTVKAPLLVEITVTKMKQEKQPAKPVQQELIAQIPQAHHAQVVMENAPLAIKALQTVKVAKAETTYQAQVAIHVLQMLIVLVVGIVLTAIHILQNQEIAVLEPHVQTDSIFQEQHAMDVLLMPVVMVQAHIRAIADIYCRTEAVSLHINNPYAKTQGYALLVETSAEIGC